MRAVGFTHAVPASFSEATIATTEDRRLIRNVVLLQAGRTLNGARFYSEGAVAKSAQKFEGTKLWWTHGSSDARKGFVERDLREHVGYVEHVRVDRQGKARLIGDFHFLPATVNSPIVEEAWGRLGIPEIRQGYATSWEGNGVQRSLLIDSQPVAHVESLTEVRGVAIVPEGNAGGRFTEAYVAAERDETMYETLTLEALLAERPDIAEAIKAQAKPEPVTATATDLTKPITEALAPLAKQVTSLAEAIVADKAEREADRKTRDEADRRGKVKSLLAEAKLTDKARSLAEALVDPWADDLSEAAKAAVNQVNDVLNESTAGSKITGEGSEPPKEQDTTSPTFEATNRAFSFGKPADKPAEGSD